jgi:hypothetical protein
MMPNPMDLTDLEIQESRRHAEPRAARETWVANAARMQTDQNEVIQSQVQNRTAHPAKAEGIGSPNTTKLITDRPGPEVSAESAPAKQQPEQQFKPNAGQATSGKRDSSAISDFMARVVPWPLPGEEGVINMHWTHPAHPGMGGKPFVQLADFLAMVPWCNSHAAFVKDVYFCLSRQRMVGPTRNNRATALRNAGNATHLKAIWADIDANKLPPKGYASKPDAVAAITKFIVDAGMPPPSAMVDSGNGYHVYWISKVPITVEEWRPYAEGLWALMQTHGLHGDPLSTDSVRVLRVPDTFNNKSQPAKPVKLKLLGLMYDFAVDLKHVATTAPVQRISLPSGNGNRAGVMLDPKLFPPLAAITDENEILAFDCPPKSFPLDAYSVISRCPHYLDAIRTGGANHNQGLWMQTILGATWFEKGRNTAHALGWKHSGYTKESTDAMYDRKLQDREERGLGWPSCKAFEHNGCTQCATCPHKAKIQSPLNLAGRVPSAASNYPGTWDPPELKVSFSNVPHRKWLYGTYLIRGEVTVEAAPGGAGKTAHALAMSVEIATGFELLGETIYKAHDLKVLFINGEDSRTEMNRRIWAMCLAHAQKIPVQGPDRLFVAGTDNALAQRMSLLRTTEKNSVIDRVGFETLEAALEAIHPDLVVLDPLVAFCGGSNMNDNAVMAQLIRELKRLAASFDCAVLIVHHTRKGGGANDGNAEEISGASAIVNLARRAIMPVPMTETEAKALHVLPSQRRQYFKLVDAKSNLAPRSTDSPWYRLHNVNLPNAEPPVYQHGDGVQAVERVNLSVLQAAPATTEDQKIKSAILNLIARGKIIDGQRYPYSPSGAGANNKRALLDDAMAAVRDATAPREWPPADLKAVTDRAVTCMKAEGLLLEEKIKSKGRFRRGSGLMVTQAALSPTSAGDNVPAADAALPSDSGGGQSVNSRSID